MLVGMNFLFVDGILNSKQTKQKVWDTISQCIFSVVFQTQALRINHDKLKEILNNKDQEIPNGKDQYIVDRNSGNWSFDCRFLMCFSCRSRSNKKTDV